VLAWAFKNVRHEVGRSGAGAMPAAFRIFVSMAASNRVIPAVCRASGSS
jgi:hypothetical protein